MPLTTISIITPAYGQLDWLRLCVASVADQVVTESQDSDGKNQNSELQSSLDGSQRSEGKIQGQKFSNDFSVEHIIQDGGTPGIEEFAREMGAEFYRDGVLILGARPSTLDPRPYRLTIYSESDNGMYDAINKGIGRMKGDLWAWLNCDEQYLPGTLSYVVEWFLRNPDVGILFGDALLTDEMGNALSYRKIISPEWEHTRLVHLASLSCASFYRRSILDRGGVFDTIWRSIGDAEWMARMLKAGVKVKACGKLLSLFAFTGQNTSESPLAFMEGKRWREAPDAPSVSLIWFFILRHRLRKFFAGSYVKRNVRYALYRNGTAGRTQKDAAFIGWDWPRSGTNDPAKSHKTISVLGTDLLVTDYRDLGERLLKVLQQQKPLAVDFANTHVVTMRRHDGEFVRLTDAIDMTVPDGMPLVWAMNHLGAELKDRVYGPTFTRKFLESCPDGFTHYLVGGSEECGQRFREKMLALNPTLDFVGGYHGICSGGGVLADDEAVLEEILRKQPDFIWVGLGTPKQYAWINRIKPRLVHGVMLAVGFALDVNAGMKPDAPAWMQPLGLTWVYRMLTEPQRLIGRYLKWNSLFLFYYGLELLRGDRLFKKWKLQLRNGILWVIDQFASEIKDCVTGKSLGRGLVIGWGSAPIVFGHPGLPPLIPYFLPQRRLTYWKQSMGFTTHPAPDFCRLPLVTPPDQEGSKHKVMNILLSHRGGEAFKRVRELWRPVCEEENLWIAFGGSREDFDSLDYTRKVYIDDPELRKQDNQREKQSYAGIFQAMASVVEQERPDYIYLCEYDHLPLLADLNARQVESIRHENADVMGHWLYRVDGTGNYHALYHEADPEFSPFWASVSKREDPSVILSMFGSGSFWTRAAFLDIARVRQERDCYLELYLPTLAHHLGFRVRGWNEKHHLISNLPSPSITVEEANKLNCWTVHPVKEISAKKLKS